MFFTNIHFNNSQCTSKPCSEMPIDIVRNFCCKWNFNIDRFIVFNSVWICHVSNDESKVSQDDVWWWHNALSMHATDPLWATIDWHLFALVVSSIASKMPIMVPASESHWKVIWVFCVCLTFSPLIFPPFRDCRNNVVVNKHRLRVINKRLPIALHHHVQSLVINAN